MNNKILYKPFVSNNKKAKYSVYVMKDGKQKLTWQDKSSPNYYSIHYLW